VNVSYLACLGYLRENSGIRIPQGKEHVPRTLTTRKLANLTLHPILWRHRATFRAATCDSSSLLFCT